MKKISKILLVVLAFLTISGLCACSAKTKYSLVKGNLGTYDISNLYEYNYIEFDEKNGTYELENQTKTNNIVTRQTGTYTVDENGVVKVTNNEIPQNNILMCAGETITFVGDELRITGYISGIGNCSMTFTKS